MDEKERTKYKGMTWKQVYPDEKMRERIMFSSQLPQEKERRRKEKKARNLYQLRESLKNTEYF